MPITPFVQDSFTGTDGVTLANHGGETGATWTPHVTQQVDSAVLSSGALRSISDAGSWYWASGEPAGPNYVVEADFWTVDASPTPVYVMGRVDSASTKTYVWGGFDGTHWVLQYRYNSGDVTDIVAPVAYTPQVGHTYHLKLTLDGTSADLTVTDAGNPVAQLTGTQTQVTETGYAGLWVQTSCPVTTGSRLDSFTATDAAIQTITNGYKTTYLCRGSGLEFIQTTRWNPLSPDSSAAIVNPQGTALTFLNGGKLTRVQIRDALIGLHVQGGQTIELEDCWIHNCALGIKVDAGGKLIARRSLIEWNGLHLRDDPDLWCEGDLDVQNCIFRCGPGYRVNIRAGSTGIFSHNLVEGWLHGVYLGAALTCQQNTISGSNDGTPAALSALSAAGNGNYLVSLPKYDDPTGGGKFVHWPKGLWWLLDPAETRGCFPYNAALTEAYANARWPTFEGSSPGYMASYRITPFLPFYPGDAP